MMMITILLLQSRQGVETSTTGGATGFIASEGCEQLL